MVFRGVSFFYDMDLHFTRVKKKKKKMKANEFLNVQKTVIASESPL